MPPENSGLLQKRRCSRRDRRISHSSLKKRAGRSPRTGGNGSDERRESKRRYGRRCRRPRIPPNLFLLTPKLRLRTEALEVLRAKNSSDLYKLPDELGRQEGRERTLSTCGVHQRETHRSSEQTVPETNTWEKESSRQQGSTQETEGRACE